MSTFVRKKRNFKALQLDVSKPDPPAAPSAPSLLEPNGAATGATTAKQPVATRNAPNGRRRPPPMNLAPKVAAPAPSTAGDDNLLTVSTTPNSAPVTGTTSATRPGYHTDLTQKLANMDMNAETKYDLRNEDLKELQELGQGNGGSVKKVMHIPSGKTMAKKVSIFGHTPCPPKAASPATVTMHFIATCLDVSSDVVTRALFLFLAQGARPTSAPRHILPQ